MVSSGISSSLFLLCLLLFASCFDVEAALMKKRNKGNLDTGLRGSKGGKTSGNTDDSDNDDDDDDDDDDDNAQPVRLSVVMAPSQKAEVAKLKTELQATKKQIIDNKNKQLELKLSLRKVSDRKRSDIAIDASAKKVANETESPAMGKMLGQMWKDMRMFEVPFYSEHVQEQIRHLKKEEAALVAKQTATQKKLDAAEGKMAQEKKQAAAVKTQKQKLEKDADKEDAKDDKDDDTDDEDDEKAEQPPPVKTVKAEGVAANPALTNFWNMTPKEKEAALVGTLVYFVFGILLAALYNYVRSHHAELFMPAPSQKGRTSADFSSSLFGCFGDFKICMQGTCCPGMRWANTLDNADPNGRRILSFWKAYIFFLVMVLLHIYTYGISSFILVLSGVYYRQKLRKAFDLESGSFTSILKDFLSWSCCTCCAIIQEARETRRQAINLP